MLVNNGIGPAIIKSIKIFYKEEEHKNIDFAVFISQNFKEEVQEIGNLYHSNIHEGLLIPAQEKINLFEIDNSEPDAEKFIKFLSGLEKEGFDYEIIYSSIYNEQWRITSRSLQPEKID